MSRAEEIISRIKEDAKAHAQTCEDESIRIISQSGYEVGALLQQVKFLCEEIDKLKEENSDGTVRKVR